MAGVVPTRYRGEFLHGSITPCHFSGIRHAKTQDKPANGLGNMRLQILAWHVPSARPGDYEPNRLTDHSGLDARQEVRSALYRFGALGDVAHGNVGHAEDTGLFLN